MARGKSRTGRPPRGLVAETLTVDGEELVVFSWGGPEQLAPSLSAAEREVLVRVAKGDSNAAIARARRTSVRTVANQVASLLRKTKAASRFELIRRYAGRRG